MFTSLLVGLDGSTEAQVALAQAIIIGERFHARIVLLYVPPAPGHTGEMALGAPWIEYGTGTAQASRGDIERAAQQMLNDAAEAVRRAGLEAETVQRSGAVADVLRELAEDVGVIVVGRIGVRGRMATMGKDPLGPDTRELIRRSPRPVLVSGTRPTQMDRVLVAYAGGPASEGALALASRFAGITGAHLDVLHVSPDEEEGRQALARASGALSLDPLDFETHLIEGDLETAIPATIRRLGCNALFTGAQRRGGFWMVPTHTEVILRVTDIPVLVHLQPSSSGARVSASYRRSAFG
ncbi:MAG TPA: universal stress protein [Gemmatimonadales bacterium]|jgi:nucleotide-binding universal stress UspA family protein